MQFSISDKENLDVHGSSGQPSVYSTSLLQSFSNKFFFSAPDSQFESIITQIFFKSYFINIYPPSLKKKCQKNILKTKKITLHFKNVLFVVLP